MEVDDLMVVTVQVGDVDEPPSELPTVTATGPTGVTVTWTTPANTGPPITRYDVRYKRRSGLVTTTVLMACLVPPAACPLSKDLTGLEAGSEYRVRLRAHNDEGRSGFGPWGNGRTHRLLAVAYGAAAYAVDEGDDVTVTAVLNADADRARWAPLTVNPPGDVFTVSPATLEFVVGERSVTATFAAGEDTDTDSETVTLGFGTLPTVQWPMTKLAPMTLLLVLVAAACVGGDRHSRFTVD